MRLKILLLALLTALGTSGCYIYDGGGHSYRHGHGHHHDYYRDDGRRHR